MGLTMGERKAVTKTMAKRYRAAGRTEKTAMLDELCALTGWTRDHARRALRIAASSGGAMPERAPRPIVQVLERCGELEVNPGVRAKLLQISPATIDRVLAPERVRLRVKGRAGTKPGTLLKPRIPIRTFADWDDLAPGFCEVDLVSHDGGNPAGEFCQTLDLTCVATGWTEMRALRNKAQRWCFEALQEIEATLPFPLRGLDSDNGSEFINAQLFTWCMDNQITFTRSRPQRKNDNCFVEQKNFPVVRQQIGYLRYDTAAELAVLSELYTHLRLYVNFFQPQMHLIEKVRSGAKLTRRHDRARTPYRRILESPLVDQLAKDALTRCYLELNPVSLKLDIAGCQDRLLGLARTKPAPTRKEVDRHDHPWERAYSPRQARLQADISREATREPIRTS